MYSDISMKLSGIVFDHMINMRLSHDKHVKATCLDYGTLDIRILIISFLPPPAAASTERKNVSTIDDRSHGD
jgi:hypothetical protein